MRGDKSNRPSCALVSKTDLEKKQYSSKKGVKGRRNCPLPQFQGALA